MMNCCTTGDPAPDSYEVLGSIETIRNVQVYRSSPLNNRFQSPLGVLLVLPDGFGHARHNFILADQFAKSGWIALVPDYFEGDGLPIQLLKRDPTKSIDEQAWPEEEKEKLRTLDFPSWTGRHESQRIGDILSALVVELDSLLGKCDFQAVAAFHPSFLDEDDLDGVKSPVYVGLAGADTMVPATLHDDILKWRAKGVEGIVPFHLDVYADMPHGFAARPESDNGQIREQFARALQKGLEHLEIYAKR